MSKTAVPYIEVVVRRDANTIIPIQVPAYELGILRQIFGKENVSEEGPVGSVELDPETEYERLSAKYGGDKVAAFYGDDDGARLCEIIAKSVEKLTRDSAKPAKPTKAEKAEKAENQPVA